MKCYKYEGNSTVWEGYSYIIFADNLDEAKQMFKDSCGEKFIEADENWIEIQMTKHIELFSEWCD